jgi:hypothetical protein
MTGRGGICPDPAENRFHFCHFNFAMYHTIAIATEPCIEPTVCEEVAAAIMLVLTTMLDLLLDGETAMGMK